MYSHKLWYNRTIIWRAAKADAASSKKQNRLKWEATWSVKKKAFFRNRKSNVHMSQWCQHLSCSFYKVPCLFSALFFFHCTLVRGAASSIISPPTMVPRFPPKGDCVSHIDTQRHLQLFHTLADPHSMPHYSTSYHQLLSFLSNKIDVWLYLDHPYVFSSDCVYCNVHKVVSNLVEFSK